MLQPIMCSHNPCHPYSSYTEYTCFDNQYTSEHETDLDCGGEFCVSCDIAEVCVGGGGCTRDWFQCVLSPKHNASRLGITVYLIEYSELPVG